MPDKIPTTEIEVLEALGRVQSEISVPKDLYNSFAKYNYRNAETIMNHAKPLLHRECLTMIVKDEISLIGTMTYVTAIVLINGIEVGRASAREAISKKGMDDSQITGSTSSYARKYALNGVFLLDDVKDADSMDNSGHTSGPGGHANAPHATPKSTPPKITPAEQKKSDEKYASMLDGYKEAIGERGFTVACQLVSELDPYNVSDRETRLEIYETLKSAEAKKKDPSS
jgi:hypothetical protein